MPNDPIGTVFDYVRSLYIGRGILFPELESIERKFASETELTEPERQVWHEINRVVSSSGIDDIRQALAQLNERYRALTGVPQASLAHPLFRDEIHTEWRSFVGIDFNRSSATEIHERAVLVSPAQATFDYTQLSDVTRDDHFISFSHGGRHWTVLLPDPKTRITFGREFRLDSLLMARSYLTDTRYYRDGEGLIFHENIHFTKADAIALAPEQQMPGFSVKPFESAAFVPLLVPAEPPSGGIPAVKLSPAITAENAAQILANLKTLAASLRWAGLTMDLNSWSDLKFDVETGELIFGERARPVILDAKPFSNVLDNEAWVDGLENLPDDTFFIPDLRAYLTSNYNIITSQETLLRMISLLAEKAGEEAYGIHHDSVHELIGFYLRTTVMDKRCFQSLWQNTAPRFSR